MCTERASSGYSAGRVLAPRGRARRLAAREEAGKSSGSRQPIHGPGPVAPSSARPQPPSRPGLGLTDAGCCASRRGAGTSAARGSRLPPPGGQSRSVPPPLRRARGSHLPGRGGCGGSRPPAAGRWAGRGAGAGQSEGRPAGPLPASFGLPQGLAAPPRGRDPLGAAPAASLTSTAPWPPARLPPGAGAPRSADPTRS